MPVGINLAYETVGFKRVADIFTRMGMAAADAVPFWEEEVLPDMERVELELFRSQGRRGGGSWKFLSPETINAKARKGQNPLINIATGEMLRSLSDPEGQLSGLGGGKSGNAIREVYPNMIRFGTSAPGAAESQTYRPIIRFTKFDRARWARWFVRYIVRVGQESGVKPSDG